MNYSSTAGYADPMVSAHAALAGLAGFGGLSGLEVSRALGSMSDAGLDALCCAADAALASPGIVGLGKAKDPAAQAAAAAAKQAQKDAAAAAKQAAQAEKQRREAEKKAQKEAAEAAKREAKVAATAAKAQAKAAAAEQKAQAKTASAAHQLALQDAKRKAQLEAQQAQAMLRAVKNQGKIDTTKAQQEAAIAKVKAKAEADRMAQALKSQAAQLKQQIALTKSAATLPQEAFVEQALPELPPGFEYAPNPAYAPPGYPAADPGYAPVLDAPPGFVYAEPEYDPSQILADAIAKQLPALFQNYFPGAAPVAPAPAPFVPSGPAFPGLDWSMLPSGGAIMPAGDAYDYFDPGYAAPVAAPSSFSLFDYGFADYGAPSSFDPWGDPTGFDAYQLYGLGGGLGKSIFSKIGDALKNVGKAILPTVAQAIPGGEIITTVIDAVTGKKKQVKVKPVAQPAPIIVQRAATPAPSPAAQPFLTPTTLAILGAGALVALGGRK